VCDWVCFLWAVCGVRGAVCRVVCCAWLAGSATLASWYVRELFPGLRKCDHLGCGVMRAL
jgi:hypothetical protein